ncbi:HAD family phosphatase [Fertoebacter nigrum]|uniref:HAD family phosphatase n=1 Tax=Fertoeibacter niger TaxID=2656921 RepID=A0A8X8KM34_9RHOB|nr:HAD family phosphatase [Fertoeibacter niger]NUB45949.1 HAD family phosphatase [Fertoeibacter niger]
MKPLVIFDFDGVIADSEIIALAELQTCLAAHGLDLSMETLIDRFLGASLASITQALADHTGADVAGDFREAWYSGLFARYRCELTAVPGINALFDFLDEARIDYCIASGSSHRRLGFALDCLDLTERFAGRAFSAEDVMTGKPEPDLMLLAAHRRGAACQDCIVVEDATAGVLSARRAGMRAVGFVGGSHLKDLREHQSRRLTEAGTFATAIDHGHTREFLRGMLDSKGMD